MPSWAEVEQQAPELAAKVRGRFERFGLGTLATLRKDGSPRVSPVEVTFAGGELWLGMMARSRKADDLVRDGRMALHSASADKEVKEGDAKLAGVAVEVGDDAGVGAFLDAAAGGEAHRPEPGTFQLFRVDVREISHLVPAGDHLVIETWRDGGGTTSVKRY